MVALPDEERRTRYTPVSPTTSFEVGFTIYEVGGGEDQDEEIEVYLDGVLQSGNWTLADATTFEDGESVDAEIEVDAPGWTGTVDIVGARRPRRTAQFIEGRGVPAVSHNLAHNIGAANLREIWDRIARWPWVNFAATLVDFGGMRTTGGADATDDTGFVTRGQVDEILADVVSGGVASAASLVSQSGGMAGATVQAALNNADTRLDAEETLSANHEARIDVIEAAAGLPVGLGPLPWPTDTPPTGWLLCYGQAVNRTTYSALFAVISTLYGVGDGSTTFNMPDLRGRLTAGKDSMGGTAANRLQASTTITTTSGSPTATVASATGLAVGMFVLSANVPAATTILTISGTTITLSANATASAGGTAARFSLISDPQVIGGVGGTDEHITLEAQMALHGHPFRSKSDTVGSPSFTTTGGFPTNNNATGLANRAAFTGTPADAVGQQIGGSGGGQPHPNVQPTLISNFIMFAGV